MPAALTPATIAQINKLRADGLSPSQIAARLGVSYDSVGRYLDPSRRLSASEGSRGQVLHPRNVNPLYDPRRDGVVPRSLTAMICGDPPAGRRELLAANPWTYDFAKYGYEEE